MLACVITGFVVCNGGEVFTGRDERRQLEARPSARARASCGQRSHHARRTRPWSGARQLVDAPDAPLLLHHHRAGHAPLGAAAHLAGGGAPASSPARGGVTRPREACRGCPQVGLFVVRVAALYFGHAVGARWGAMPHRLRSFGWMAYVTQAGLSLGLASEIATDFAGWGPPLKAAAAPHVRAAWRRLLTTDACG